MGRRAAVARGKCPIGIVVARHGQCEVGDAEEVAAQRIGESSADERLEEARHDRGLAGIESAARAGFGRAIDRSAVDRRQDLETIGEGLGIPFVARDLGEESIEKLRRDGVPAGREDRPERVAMRREAGIVVRGEQIEDRTRDLAEGLDRRALHRRIAVAEGGEQRLEDLLLRVALELRHRDARDLDVLGVREFDPRRHRNAGRLDLAQHLQRRRDDRGRRCIAGAHDRQEGLDDPRPPRRTQVERGEGLDGVQPDDRGHVVHRAGDEGRKRGGIAESTEDLEGGDLGGQVFERAFGLEEREDPLDQETAVLALEVSPAPAECAQDRLGPVEVRPLEVVEDELQRPAPGNLRGDADDRVPILRSGGLPHPLQRREGLRPLVRDQPDGLLAEGAVDGEIGEEDLEALFRVEAGESIKEVGLLGGVRGFEAFRQRADRARVLRPERPENQRRRRRLFGIAAPKQPDHCGRRNPILAAALDHGHDCTCS